MESLDNLLPHWNKNISKKIEELEILDSLGQANANDLNMLGMAHHAQKNYAKALEYYYRSALSASSATPLFNMGLVFNDPEVSQDADAVDAYRRAIELDPNFERAKKQLDATKRKLIPLAKRVKALKPLLDPSEYFQFYLSPFEALQIVPSDLENEAGIKKLQKAKKHLLHEVQLNDGRVSWLDDYAIDISRAVVIDDDLRNDQLRCYHAAIFDNRPLLRFLTRGELDHFLYSDDYFPKSTIELLEAEPAFLQFISKPFAQQYDLLLSRALDRKLLDAIEVLFDGRRWVLPQHDDICFQGANKRISNMLELLQQIEIKAIEEKPSLDELEEILREHKIVEIFNLLPTQFRNAQTQIVAHIRSLAITCYNKYDDSELSQSILTICKRFRFKSIELNKLLDDDFQTISELITQERKYEVRLTLNNNRTFAITKEGIRDGNRFFPASSITKLRWGITLTGYQAIIVFGKRYEYLFQATNDRNEHISIYWSASKRDELSSTQQFNLIIQAALAYLARPVLERILNNLDNGRTETIGSWTLSSKGISYRSNGLLFVTQHFIAWQDVSISIYNGQVILSHASQSDNHTFASIRDTDNAVLLPILAQIMKERVTEPARSDSDVNESARSDSGRTFKLRRVFFGLIGILVIYFLFFSQPSSQSKLNEEIEIERAELISLENELRLQQDRIDALKAQIQHLRSQISRIEQNAKAGLDYDEWEYEQKIQEHNDLVDSYNSELRTYNLIYATYERKLYEVNEKIRLLNQMR